MRRFSFSWSLAAEAIRLATFSCKEPWVLIGLLAVSTVPPYVELANRGRPTRVYVLHMALFVGLLVLGWAAVEAGGRERPRRRRGRPSRCCWPILIRCGTVPAHCWVTDWFEHASLRHRAPVRAPAERRLRGRPARPADRAGLGPAQHRRSSRWSRPSTPPAWRSIQREARRFFAYLFLSHASLVLVGLELRHRSVADRRRCACGSR